MNQQIKTHSVYESVHQWMSEVGSRWVSESVHPWISESIHEGISESMNQFIMNQSSLRYVVSQLLLLGAASYLGYFSQPPLSCLPASSSATQILFSRSSSNAFSNLQLQSCLSGASQHDWTLCAQPCQCGSLQQVANPQRRSGAPNRPTLAQSQQLFAIFVWNRAPTTACMVYMLSTSSSKSAFGMTVFQHVEVQTVLSLQSSAFFFVDNFARSRPTNEKTETLLRRPQEPHYPKKDRVSRPRMFFTHELTCFRTVALPNYLMVSGWHDDVVDMMVWVNKNIKINTYVNT